MPIYMLMFVKYAPAILLILICHQAHSQDTIYYDKESNKIAWSEEVEKIEVIYRDSTTRATIVKTYYSDFSLKGEDRYSTYSSQDKIRGGPSKSWYRNGNLKSEISYVEGVCRTRTTYWPNGKIKREDMLDGGDLTKGKCFDSLGNEMKYYEYEQMPQFPGGINGLMQFLSRNIKYPRASFGRAEEGIVDLSFIIDEGGQIQSIKVVKGVSKLIDSEAVRVLKKMPRWSPGIQDGELVQVRYVLPINFKTNLSEREKERRRKKYSANFGVFTKFS